MEIDGYDSVRKIGGGMQMYILYSLAYSSFLFSKDVMINLRMSCLAF